jgi:hypothetical protein
MKLDGCGISISREHHDSTYLGLVQMIGVGEWDCDLETPIIPHRLGKSNHLRISQNPGIKAETTHAHPIRIGRTVLKDDPLTIRSNSRRTLSSDGYSLKLLLDPLLQSLNAVFANDDQLHPLGAVLGLPPFHELLSWISTVLLGFGP